MNGVPSAPSGYGAVWVDAWREAVRASPLALGLFELPSTEFVEMSPRAAELLGTTRDAGLGLDYLAIVDHRPEVEQVVGLVTAGALDSVQGRRRLRRMDGSVVDVLMCARAIRSRVGADLGLWVAWDELGGREPPAVPSQFLAELPDRLASLEPEVAHPAIGTLDHRWRVEQLSTEVEELFGHRPADVVGSSILDLTHPRDVADLLLAFAQATSDVYAAVRVRLRHRYRSWQTVTAVVTVLDGGGPPSFAFVVAADEQPEPSADRKRVAELEQHLQRIAFEVQAAGALRVPVPTDDATRVPAFGELSARQWEVMSRLARGERVATIAREMYVSPSTIRNHLSAIFRKTGVHSQQELLVLLRRAQQFV